MKLPALQRFARAAAFAACTLATLVAPAQALHVTTWNLLDYPNLNFSGRQPRFRTVMQALDTDVMVVQELKSAAGADSFLAVLNSTWPARIWKGGGSTFIQVAESAIYYDSLQVSISNLTSINTGGPRQVLIALVKPNGYKSTQSQFRVYSMHLKAGTATPSTTDSTTRRTECTSLRSALNTAPAGTNLLVGGDTNFYGDWEGGYIRLVESQLDNDGRLKDPLSMLGTWNNGAYAAYESQSPCATGCGTNFSTGGLDDRFDLWLASYSLNDGLGLDVVSGGLPNGYGAFGNDGQHFNSDVNGGGFNTAVGLAVATALHDAADHLPVIVTLQLPAKLATANALAFGDAIVGGSPTQNLSVDDLPAPPAATLSYSLAAPAGFTAPAGSFTNAASAPPAIHSIGMTTASVGTRSGTLLVNSNDLDTTSKAVLLTGRVLAHAVPSLDSATIVTSRLVDFGVHLGGEFRDTTVRVHDQGYGSLQARLSVDGTTLAGGAGRFSIVGGFTPTLLAGTGHSYALHFDDTGAALDSTYEATLTFASSDEPLPGATAQPDLVVTLRARRANGTGAVGDGVGLRFHPPSPNPLHRGTTLAFDLPARAHVSLAIFDAHGRRVALLADGELGEGRHSLRWNAQDEGGRAVPAGLYFVRFVTPGLTRVQRLAVLP